jgi:hypothetical protein
LIVLEIFILNSEIRDQRTEIREQRSGIRDQGTGSGELIP